MAAEFHEQAVELAVSEYRSRRFEDYMKKVDTGEMTRALAISALRDECEYIESEVSDGA